MIFDMSDAAREDPEVLEALWQVTLLLIATCEGDSHAQEECLGCLRIMIKHRRNTLGIEHEDLFKM